MDGIIIEFDGFSIVASNFEFQSEVLGKGSSGFVSFLADDSGVVDDLDTVSVVLGGNITLSIDGVESVGGVSQPLVFLVKGVEIATISEDCERCVFDFISDKGEAGVRFSNVGNIFTEIEWLARVEVKFFSSICTIVVSGGISFVRVRHISEIPGGAFP